MKTNNRTRIDTQKYIQIKQKERRARAPQANAPILACALSRKFSRNDGNGVRGARHRKKSRKKRTTKLSITMAMCGVADGAERPTLPSAVQCAPRSESVTNELRTNAAPDLEHFTCHVMAHKTAGAQPPAAISNHCDVLKRMCTHTPLRQFSDPRNESGIVFGGPGFCAPSATMSASHRASSARYSFSDSRSWCCSTCTSSCL